MPTLETLSERVEPVAPSSLGGELLARFEREPDTLVIPVVENDRPVGLIERTAFLQKIGNRFGHALYDGRPVSFIMDEEPAVVEGDLRIDAFCEIMLKSGPAALLRGFVVTRNGRYHGVGTAATLLRVVHDQQQSQTARSADHAASLKDSQAQALAAARAKSQFLSVVSHELRTPMNGVLAVAELLRRQPLNEAAQAHVQTIVDSSETLLRILQDAVDLSKAEAGELDMTPVATPLRALMDDVQAAWRSRASQDGVTLLVGYEGDTELAAVIDGERVKQVFNNLIGNALEFARNGVIEAGLKAWVDGDQVRIEARVRDDGPGVEQNRLDGVFEPAGADAGSASAGLGLSISRQIVDRMGGRIWAENNLGRGVRYHHPQRATFDRPTER